MNVLTLVGMIGVMLYINWRFTLIALSVAPVLLVVVYTFTRRIKKASRAVRKKESELVSVVEEVLTSIRVVKAFAREDYEVKRFESQSLRKRGDGARSSEHQGEAFAVCRSDRGRGDLFGALVWGTVGAGGANSAQEC